MRNKQIDGLRGIAITLIVLFHVINRFQQIYLGTNIWFMNQWGNFGTVIFFVISGFYLGKVAVVDKECRLNVKGREFIGLIAKRILRLWPSFAAAATIIFLVTNLAKLPSRTYGWSVYISNLLLLNRYLGIEYLDGAYWFFFALISASVSVYFIKCFFNDSFLAYLLWTIMASILDCSLSGLYLLGGSFASVVCIGISLRHILEENKRWYVVFTVNIVLTFFFAGKKVALEAIIVVLFVSLAFYKKFVALESRLLGFMSKLSYPLYLVHQNLSYSIEYKILLGGVLC